nr:GNAT family protein [Paenibacillus lemnae]
MIPELAGSRLRLRRLTEHDREDMYQCWTDPETVRHLYLPPVRTTADAKELILLLNQLSYSEEVLRWGIELLETGVVIGSCGLNTWQLKGAFRGEFGCEMSSAYWGQGYMAEAAGLVMEFAFAVMGINRLEALSDVENERAAAFLGRLGFTREGRLRQYRKKAEGFSDAYLFSLLREEWQTG